MKRARLNLRYEKQPLFAEGLKRLGYSIDPGVTYSPRDGDVLVTWNRIHEGDKAARVFSDLGLPVIVAENATWGNDFCGERWYTLALDFHNVAGKFPILGNERWDSLNVELAEIRQEGETIILPSRGIGPTVHRMPSNWPERMRAQYPHARIRPHPGQRQAVELIADIRNCDRVVTWGSGAAVKALMWGCKVESHMPDWIGACEDTAEDRLRMLRELSWGQARLSEIASGEAFQRLLQAR